MDLGNYTARIQKIEEQLSVVKNKITDVEKEIEEAEAASTGAVSLRGAFDAFVENRKKAIKTPTKGNALKSFASFISKATSLLTGDSYLNANKQLDEMDKLISDKLNLCNDDLEELKKELKSLELQKQSAESDYRAALKALENAEVQE